MKQGQKGEAYFVSILPEYNFETGSEGSIEEGWRILKISDDTHLRRINVRSRTDIAEHIER